MRNACQSGPRFVVDLGRGGAPEPVEERRERSGAGDAGGDHGAQRVGGGRFDLAQLGVVGEAGVQSRRCGGPPGEVRRAQTADIEGGGRRGCAAGGVQLRSERDGEGAVRTGFADGCSVEAGELSWCDRAGGVGGDNRTDTRDHPPVAVGQRRVDGGGDRSSDRSGGRRGEDSGDVEGFVAGNAVVEVGRCRGQRGALDGDDRAGGRRRRRRCSGRLWL